MQKRTKRDMACYLDIDAATLYNWRKNKPNLYRIVMLGFKFDELIEKSKQTYEELQTFSELIEADISSKNNSK